jgi:hypothetical protein
VIQDLGHDAAVGVVPTGDTGAIAGINGVLEDGLVLVKWDPFAGGGVFERDEKAAGRDIDGVGWDASEKGRDDVASEYTSGNDVGEDGGLSGEFVEGGEFETRKTALIELLIGELVEQKPDNARPELRRCQRDLDLVECGRGVEVAGLPAVPDELREDEQTGEGEEPEDDSGRVLDSFKAGNESLPEDGDRDKSEETRYCNGVGKPIRNLGAREVGDGVEKDRWQSEDKGRPDDDPKSAGPFGQREKRCEEQRECDDIDDDRNDDGGGRTNEVVDKVVFGGDKRTGEVEQIQISQAKSDRDGMSKGLHSLFSFKPR